MELVIICVIIMIVFGAGKLPGIIEELGKGMRKFRDEISHDDKGGK